MLEYHPAPWDQWVTVGNIQVGRNHHAVLSVGPQQLPCLAGDHKESEEVSSSSSFSSSITSSSSLSSSIEELPLKGCQPFITIFQIIWVWGSKRALLSSVSYLLSSPSSSIQEFNNPMKLLSPAPANRACTYYQYNCLNGIKFNLSPMPFSTPITWTHLCWSQELQLWSK